MPSISSGKVLVTGANGFIAAWVVHDLLEYGFSVRGSVRSDSKATYLREHFATYGDKFEVTIVKDMTMEGAFDEAAAGVDAIVHAASPVVLDSDDPTAVITPAVEGTRSLLSSALKHRATVRRLLLLSSTATVQNSPPTNHTGRPIVLDESSWNETSLREVERGKATGVDIYSAGKTLAERAAWKLVEDQEAKGGLGWDLVTLVPPVVFGPIIHEAPNLDSFGGTPRMWYDHIVKGNMPDYVLTQTWSSYVDVRDLARAHVLALTVPEAGGNRIIVHAGPYVGQKFIDGARRVTDRIPARDSFGGPQVGTIRFNAEKSVRVLGLHYRSLEETAEDTAKDLQARGWMP